MRFLVFSGICLLLMAPSCQDEASSALRRSQVARSWVREAPDSLQRWVRFSTFDPYQKGTSYPGDAGNPEILELSDEGEFHEFDTAQQSYGHWFVNPADSTFSLRYEVRNNQLIDESSVPESARQVYKLIKMTTDSLILEVQGRHGMLTICYLPASTEPLPLE